MTGASGTNCQPSSIGRFATASGDCLKSSTHMGVRASDSRCRSIDARASEVPPVTQPPQMNLIAMAATAPRQLPMPQALFPEEFILFTFQW